MKVLALILSLSLSALCFADIVTIDKNGETAVLNGQSKGSAAEVLRIISAAHEVGYKTPKGADIFEKEVVKEGRTSLLSLQSKSIFVSRDARLFVSYQVIFKGKPGDIWADDVAQKLVVSGQIAKSLMGAMRLVINPNSWFMTPEWEAIQTASGRVHCELDIIIPSETICKLSL